MSSFYLTLTDEEINYIYLAAERAMCGNSNKEAVKVFEGIQEKLAPYTDDGTKMAATIMKRTSIF